MLKRSILLLFLCLLTAHFTQAQDGQTVQGQVMDAQTGESLPGVNVLVEGTSQGASTDNEGNFEVAVNSLDATLVFSFIGYSTEEVPLDGRTELTVNLEPKAISGDEVVVVGYGTQNRGDITSSISTVDVEETLASRPISDLGSGLQGTVSGLTISTPSGEIGSNPDITLRGMQGSINSSSASPLILVDGVEVDNINQVNPSSVESISVLKDAASTAIYGTRAAWGAILITTKYGEKGEAPSISYNNSFSASTPTTDLNLAPAAPGAEMAFSAMQRHSPSTTRFCAVGVCIDEQAISKMRDWEQQYGDQNLSDEMVMGRDFEVRDGGIFFYRPWDAGEMYMKDWTPMQRHNMNISGGSENTSYNIGLGYLQQNGVLTINTDKWQRYNVDVGIKTTVNSWLDARGKFQYAQTDHVKPYPNARGTYDSWYYLYRWPITYPYGTYEGQPFRSSLTELQQANDSKDETAMSRINVGATANLAEDLSLDVDFTYTNTDNHLHQTGGSVTANNFWFAGGAMNYETYTSSGFNHVRYSSSWKKRGNLRGVLNYEKDFSNHTFKLTGGGESEIYRDWYQSSQRNGLLDEQMGEIGLATGDQYVGGSRNHWATLGFFGRVNYDYDNKYLLQVNGRYDGSSRFPANQRWGFFPSVSVGYRITEEPFMEFTEPVLTSMKIRGSYGSVGNTAVGQYPFISTMSNYSSDWLIGSSEPQQTFYTPGAVSQSLTWETVTTLDIGMDATFFEDKLNFTFDWYERTTSNMLTGGVTLPSTFGTGAPRRNHGEMRTRGWEVELGWSHSFGQESFLNITGSLSDFQEEITKYANTTKSIPDAVPAYHSAWGQYYEGMTLGEIWGYETDRLFTENDFQQDDNGNLLTDSEGNYILKDGIPDQSLYEDGSFSYGPGDVKYKDLNGDGEITYGSNTVDEPGDQRVIGNSTPRYQYGLRVDGGWKGFDASVFFQGVAKRDFWADGPVFIPGYRPHEGLYEHQLDYWTSQNTDAFYPRPADHRQQYPSEQRNFLAQTRYMLDMSYLRIKNITLGYTLPSELTSRLNIRNLRVYVSAENLFEVDNMNIPVDPETQYTSSGLNAPNSFGRVYPFQRTISGGINISF